MVTSFLLILTKNSTTTFLFEVLVILTVKQQMHLNNKTSLHTAEQFENFWLARYPRPNRCVHNNGMEFTGFDFQNLLHRYGVKDIQTNIRTPQANGICEKMHQTVGEILRIILHTNPPQNENDSIQVIDNALATCMHATRCAVNAAMQTSPEALVYRWDMLMLELF